MYMEFCLIKNNVIVDGPRLLPQNFENISNFNALSLSEIKEYGWLPYRYIITKTDTNVLVSKNIEVFENEVVETEICRELTQQEIVEKENLKLERKWKQVRNKRNKLLSESDWTQLPDSSVNKTIWSVYRTELRQLPQNFSDPDSIVWPIPPNS